METPEHKPSYIPQIGIPEREKFQEKVSTRAIYHKATSPGFFGLIVLFFFLPFINIKCGGRLVKEYSGVDIIQGKENVQDKKNGVEVEPVRQSAYHQFEMARENFKWKQKLQEDYEEYVDDAPYFEDDFSATDDFAKIPETIDDASKNPTAMRLVTCIAFICAVVGLIVSFSGKSITSIVQVILGLVGFVCMLLLERFVKVTLPKMQDMEAANNAMVTIELAIGYWMVLFLFLGISIVSFMKLRWQKKWIAANKPLNTT
jgi:hypothetical protein